MDRAWWIDTEPPPPSRTTRREEGSGKKIHLRRGTYSASLLRGEEERQRLAIELRESLQIDGIDAALTKFALGDKRLRSPERLRHLHLRQACSVTRITKAPQQELVFGAVNRAAAAVRAVLHRGACCTLFRDTP